MNRPPRKIAEEIVDKLEPTLIYYMEGFREGKFFGKDNYINSFNRREQMIKIVEDGFIAAFQTSILR